MGFIHDRLAMHGHQIDYLTVEQVPDKWRTGLGRRFGFPFLVRQAAVEAFRHGHPYDIVNVHEPHAFPMTIGTSSAGSPSVFVTSHGLERRAWTLAKEEARLGRGAVALKTRVTYPATSLWPGTMGLRRADHIFCLNEEDRTYLVNRLGRSTHSITRIFPAADLIYAATERDYRRADRLLFAAAWRDNKGISDLVPAFTTLAARHPSMTLSVVGAGVPDAEVQSRFPSTLHHRIVFASPPDEEGTAATFAGSDLFLLPSLFEGTPLTLMQAMMSGLPIVTTSTCGMKDVITHNENGLLIPIRSPEAIVAAVERLVADQAVRERLGRSAQAAARTRYTWDRVAQPVEHAYLRARDAAA